MQLEFCQQFFEKYSIIKFHENPSSDQSSLTRTERRTERMTRQIKYLGFLILPKHLKQCWKIQYNTVANESVATCRLLTSKLYSCKNVQSVRWVQVPFSFIHSIVCLRTSSKPLPKRILHIVRSRVSSFKWEYPLLSIRSSSSLLCLLPRLSVTSITPFIFHSIARCRRHFLCKMWPIQ